MSRQDKATTERFTKTLRELVKKPENKLCADCKRNGARLFHSDISNGVFLCIRCSGIHRGMGTHISRVKSVDLDVWTPEQMESIQKWGNYRANLYWEAHLKAGHIPPDHKMESFIRSKYESRRWAMEGPPPQDPSMLENGSSATPPPPPPQQQQQSATPVHQTARASPSRVPVTNRQPQPHHLLSASYASQHKTQPTPAAAAPAPAPPPPQPKPSDDLFSLDFHSPVSSSPPPQQDTQQKKDVKQDILSLFSSPPSAAPTPTSPWGQPQPQQQQQQQQTTSMIGANGAGMWGVSSGWNSAAAPPPPPQQSLWGASAPQQPQSQPSLFASSAAIWGTPAPSNGISQTSNDLFRLKKDDVFGDIWGDFK
ncbi:uncharacterized protein EV420DRAFT_1522201 [Desarmillaria tabescens]|uniref:Arf-GAP domain-containing protein n=1 Tax=Armillaria tabescens TaxID=1929756 RepID=A0AA39TQI2_ARMTA|nr:uncharacterized protein EV420DRAFT_1522201 [Desarmillaria tabescens]KAK0463003.1 hypothetical protein EV420DRAFT_1522201 [Desarmillaria tabescens]